MSEQAAQVVTQAVTEAPKVETQTPQTAPEPQAPKPDEMAAKFAALAKKERYNRMLAQQAKQRFDAITKREQELSVKEKTWEEKFRVNPLEALKERFGLSYQDLTNAALNEGKFDAGVELKRVNSEIQKLREEQDAKEKKALESQRAAQQQEIQETISQFKENISTHIEKNAEKYELTKFYDASELVYQTVEEYFDRTKRILSMDEACELVETYIDNELDRASKESKKFQSKFLKPKTEEKESALSKSSTTLSNSMNSSSAPSFLPKKTEDDRLKRALAALGN